MLCCAALLIAWLQVRTTYAAVSQLNRELMELQHSSAEFEAALQAVGTRGELAEVKRRLEGHQALLAQWEEKVAKQLELISELQSPTKRNSMMAAAVSSAASLHRASVTASGAAGAAAGLAFGSSSGSFVGLQQQQGPDLSSSFAGQLSGAAANIAQLLGDSRASSAFGSSFGLMGGGLTGAASAPSSPALWERGSPGGGLAAGVARRSAFTPGPALNGMGDSTPGGGSTPR